jgi:hypothetical protein
MEYWTTKRKDRKGIWLLLPAIDWVLELSSLLMAIYPSTCVVNLVHHQAGAQAIVLPYCAG